jgi:hypothetical protein
MLYGILPPATAAVVVYYGNLSMQFDTWVEAGICLKVWVSGLIRV